MINKYRPHILVIPEDDANRQILNGFLLEPSLDDRAIQVMPPAGGWTKVRDKFKNDYASEMRSCTHRTVLLVIDFDEHEDRLSSVKKEIPEDLSDRVFILGVLSDPERLCSDTKLRFESIGQALARDCHNGTNVLWGHDLLKHNKTELQRMVVSVKPFLFRPANLSLHNLFLSHVLPRINGLVGQACACGLLFLFISPISLIGPRPEDRLKMEM